MREQSSVPLSVSSLLEETLDISRGLDRPLRYVQLNSFYNGSTGTIMRNLHAGLTSNGVDSFIFWGRNHATVNDHERCCATKSGYLLHGVMTRLTDRMGFYSKRDTARLLSELDEIDPDIVHIHNIHGYYLNIEMLFNWLLEHRCQVRWTLHDCWALTGHCSYFSYVDCKQWRTHCSLNGDCPQLKTYPRTICKTACSRNYADKKYLFSQLPVDRMTIITPSRWLADLVEDSYLSKYLVMVRYNTIDASVFKPTSGDFRDFHGIGNRYMVLGVANPWTERKGLSDFLQLASDLDCEKYAIVLVGLSNDQIKRLPDGIIGLGRTGSQRELAEIYTSADILLNPTREDNYPTVNLEAEACGTAVITYDAGGSCETIARDDSAVVVGYADALHIILERGK